MKRGPGRSLGLAATFLMLAGQGFAATPDPGLALAQSCFSCHGENGRGGGAIPPIAGQTTDDLMAKLHGFADGTLTGTIMPRIVSGYSTDELALIADWLSKVTP